VQTNITDGAKNQVISDEVLAGLETVRKAAETTLKT
jgi:hypothetical protein